MMMLKADFLFFFDKEMIQQFPYQIWGLYKLCLEFLWSFYVRARYLIRILYFDTLWTFYPAAGF